MSTWEAVQEIWELLWLTFGALAVAIVVLTCVAFVAERAQEPYQDACPSRVSVVAGCD